MAVEYKEILCHMCKGAGEVEGIPGEYGYEPVYEDCHICNGDGCLKLYPDAVYNPDKM